MDGREILVALLRGVHLAAQLSLFGTLVFPAVVPPAPASAGLPKRPACERSSCGSRAPARHVRYLPERLG